MIWSCADLPDAEAPHHQQADFGEERHGGAEQGPGLVDAVVHRRVVIIGLAEAGRLALSWAKALTTRMPGMTSASTLVTSAQMRSTFEAGAQAVPHQMDHPGDEGQGRRVTRASQGGWKTG